MQTTTNHNKKQQNPRSICPRKHMKTNTLTRKMTFVVPNPPNNKMRKVKYRESGHRVIPAFTPGVAAQEAFQCHAATLPCPILLNSLSTIGTTSRRVPALCPQQGRYKGLVKLNKEEEKGFQMQKLKCKSKKWQVDNRNRNNTIENQRIEL
jgi:hypothetical protein